MKNIKQDILNEFGKYYISKVRDDSYKDFIMSLRGDFTSASAHKIKSLINALGISQHEILNKLVLSILDEALHNFLWMIEQSDDFDLIAKTEEGIISLKEISDGLCGELYTEDGWIHQFSAYPEIRK